MIDLNKLIPGFKDPEKRKKLIRRIDDYVIGIGFTQKEADSINDPRIILLAYRAMTAHHAKGGQVYDGYAGGGVPNPYNLGSYSDGGRLLKGPGDGVSDSIPATIGHGQPARLADGEFVVPARIVSELGNGSTDAGARELYTMMDRIQAGRKKTVGKDQVAKNSKSVRHLPA
jgi:hypothetical protein